VTKRQNRFVVLSLLSILALLDIVRYRRISSDIAGRVGLSIFEQFVKMKYRRISPDIAGQSGLSVFEQSVKINIVRYRRISPDIVGQSKNTKSAKSYENGEHFW
jgi:hypothetical protein